MPSSETLFFNLTGKKLPIFEKEKSPELDKILKRTLQIISSKQKPVILNGQKYIQLQHDPTCPAMAGYDYAVYLWENQIKPKISQKDYELGFTILFPTHVNLVNDSFIDSLLGCILEFAPNKTTFKNVKIHSEDAHTQKDIDTLYNDLAKDLN